MALKFTSNRQLHDKNTKAVAIAQRRLEQVAPVAQERYNNALAVNGYSAIIYNRLDTGIRCSCTQVVSVDPTNTALLDENGNASQEHIHNLLSHSFSISDYGITDSNTAAQKVLTSEGLVQSNLRTYEVDTGNPSLRPEHYRSDLLDNPLASDVGIDIDVDDFELNPGMSTASKCTTCYGTGFVSGFSVNNGLRIILSPQTTDVDAFGYSVNQNAAPHSWQNQSDPASYVDFGVVIPRNVLSVDRIRVWNNGDDVTTQAVLELGATSSSLQPLTSSSLLTNAIGTRILIRVSAVDTFTSVELQFNLSQIDTNLDYPKLSKTGDLSVLDATSSVNLVVGPTVYRVAPWDVIYDNVNNKFWRVTNATNFQDKHRVIHGWDIDARLVQAYEIYNQLPVRNKNNPNIRTTQLPRF